jgi:dCMP deaminase
MPIQHDFDIMFLKMARVPATLSKDPKTKVAALIVTPDNRQISFGYNGFSRGMKEDAQRWKRPVKYEYVIHAEMNAIMNCPFDTNGTTLYCTYQPCHRCLQHLINAGIRRVVYARPYEQLQFREIWDEAASHFDDIKCIDIDND